ncbi:class E sortase [Streptomyces tardus]|nr:class E sortase [Streptomyces tardus]
MTHPHDPYGEPTDLEDAVGRLSDPLNDPLPGAAPRPPTPRADSAAHRGGQQGGTGSPWFRPQQARAEQQPYAGGYTPAAAAAGSSPDHNSPRWRGPQAEYDPLNDPLPGTTGAPGTTEAPGTTGAPGQGRRRTPERSAGPQSDTAPGRSPDPLNTPLNDPLNDPLSGADADRPTGDGPPAGRGRRRREYEPERDGQRRTHTPEDRPDHEPRRRRAARPDARKKPYEGQPPADSETMALRQAEKSATAASTGTAANGGRKKDGDEPDDAGGRVARRKAAARAAKQRRTDLGTVASRAVGELFITTGVLLLLFVTYQLWWTNIQANQQANKEANNLERSFEAGDGEEPEAFEAGEGFAIMYIPKLDVRVPVAEGIEKGGVLDRGMAGHYDKKSGIETAMPWDKKGNFAVAGHRNTHGEPFRYINKLDEGDEIIVETRSTYYTYEVASRLASTSPRNIDVVSPVPKESGFTKEGRYLTLTTCTPEFSSKYRLIVWGTMVDEHPRNEGKPDALG